MAEPFRLPAGLRRPNGSEKARDLARQVFGLARQLGGCRRNWAGGCAPLLRRLRHPGDGAGHLAGTRGCLADVAHGPLARRTLPPGK